MYFSFTLYPPYFQPALYHWANGLWVCGFLLLELEPVPSEMDGSKVAQAGSVSVEKQRGLSHTNVLSSFGIRQCSCAYIPLLRLKSQRCPVLLFAL